jgi:hypothetical protein
MCAGTREFAPVVSSSLTLAGQISAKGKLFRNERSRLGKARTWLEIVAEKARTRLEKARTGW